MYNIPEVKMGIVAVSRDCFPMELSANRRAEVVAACTKKNIALTEISVTVENERDMLRALDELKAKEVNALVVYLGNFGPETPETLLAQKFDGPVMFVAAAEERGDNLIGNRGDAYCGVLNASYNAGIRGMQKAYFPEEPVGIPCEVADRIGEFTTISRVLLGMRDLKIVTFGPRPDDFVACNAPIKPLFDLGVAVMENSELDLFAAYKKHADDVRIQSVVDDMAKELGTGNKMAGILPRLAQYELTLQDYVEEVRGASKYVVMANKCWPAFQTEFGFVPCYVNSRFAARMMPIACEVDIYGALSEYMIACATLMPPTILDINNTVPYDIYESEIKPLYNYKANDVFMGFHCGNTSACYLKQPTMKYQLIMNRGLEDPNVEPDITRGTLEGTIKPSPITFFRLQGTADTKLRSYVANGEVLPTEPRSFGGIGIFAIPEMARFYRHVLVEGRFPHHGGVAFQKVGKELYEVLKLLGVKDIGFNQPASMLYPTENPFK